MQDDEFFAKMGQAFRATPKATGPQGHEPADEIVKFLFSWMTDPGETGFRQQCEKDRAPGRHASSLWQTCGRRHIIQAIFKPKVVYEKFTESKVLTTGLGHALHDLWQKNYLGPSQLMYGIWHCAKCDRVYEGLMELECSNCGADWQRYVEHREYGIEIPELNLVGHCDGVILHPKTEKFYVFEFKSKSTSQFSKLKGPQLDHVWQVHAYMHGLALKGIHTEGAVIVYMDKGKQTNWRKIKGVWTPGNKANVKQYFVEYDPEIWKEIVEVCAQEDRVLGDIDKFDLNTPVYDIAEGNKLAAKYPRRCADVRCDLADDCQLREQCFNMDALEV